MKLISELLDRCFVKLVPYSIGSLNCFVCLFVIEFAGVCAGSFV